MKIFACTFFILVILLISTKPVFCKDVNFESEPVFIGKYSDLLIDSSNNLGFEGVLSSNKFIAVNKETSNFGLSKITYWFKFSIKNNSRDKHLLLELAYPLLDTCELYSIHNNKVSMESVYANEDFDKRNIKHQNPVFFINLKNGDSATYYLKINGNEQIVIPLILRNEKSFFEFALTNEIIFGILFGLLMVMILYNLFIYLTIWDKSYLNYVLYILFICLTQATITGYTFKYLWPLQPFFNNKGIVLFPALSGIFAIQFFRNFLHTREKAIVLHKVLNVVIISYILAIIVRLFGDDRTSYRLIDISGLLATVLGLTVAIKLSLQKYRPAKFFLLAWLIFLIGIILFVLRNLNILPYNIFTNYTMQAGIAIEVVLLSFALADKIKILQREESNSRERTLAVLKENEKIIRNQNIMLEGKVTERTMELTHTNNELNDTLTQLKDAQTQLIESEKLASLGQLTAGIAHEINNPINFVSANIKPLRRDIKDLLDVLAQYEDVSKLQSLEEMKSKILDIEKVKEELDIAYIKDELDILLNGIAEGAHRTVEIVKGLKNFSRLDETDINTVNINEGIQSTIVLLNNQIGDRIIVTRNLGNLPEIECYPGKLNQVFMNIINNAIYAVTEKTLEHGKKPAIWITTSKQDDQHIKISIKDNGIGMSQDIKAKIYDPFFTTKEVGKGTGLGLSIVFKIIEAHSGTIDVVTEEGVGTEFIITLPLSYK